MSVKMQAAEVKTFRKMCWNGEASWLQLVLKWLGGGGLEGNEVGGEWFLNCNFPGTLKLFQLIRKMPSFISRRVNIILKPSIPKPVVAAK